MKDYYNILGLPPSATLEEIKKAYRKLALQYHPDKTGDDQYAASQFVAIKEAYEVLSNPGKKSYYLQQRWYQQSTGKRSYEKVITPVNVLQQLLELDKYVSSLDVHRMDKQGLYDYLVSIFSDEVITALNKFDETSVNASIIQSALNCSTPLPLRYIKALSERLIKINAGESSLKKIKEFARQKNQSEQWEKSIVWIVIAAVTLISLLIYLA